MAILRLHFLGPFQATLDGRLLQGFRSDKSRALLAYLAAQESRPCARENLAALFWGEDEEQAARASLRQALSNWRKLLASLLAGSPPPLEIGRRTVRLHVDLESVWVDAIQLQNLVAACDRHPHISLLTCKPCHDRMEKAVSLYQGEFLADLQALNAGPQFDDWRLVQQEHYHQKVLHTLGWLAQSAHARREREEEIAYLRRQLVLLPWLEQSHRALMAALAATGRRTEAIAQFETCRRLLSQEMGIEPALETEALYRKIVAGKTAVPSPQLSANHNLPPVKTSFVGREAELARIDALLAQPSSRLLTLTGLGGVGKSSLALAAGRRQSARFEHGVWFVSMAEIEKGETAVSAAEFDHTLALAVLANLHQSVTLPELPLDQLRAYLRQKEMLLILDNLEHLLPEAVVFVLALLETAPELQIIATSQTQLSCRAETPIPLAGLPLPDSGTAASLRLFMERAQRHQPDFQLDDQNAADVREICRLAAGLPLAIELAAELVNHYPLSEITSAIRANLDLLHSPSPDAPPRQHSMRAVLNYGWQLLPEPERLVLAQASLFGDVFDREAILAVTDASLSHIVNLVNRTWLTLARPGRYALHELVRQVAAEALAAAPDVEAETHARFARYYAGFLARQAANLTTANQGTALTAINEELAHIRQAWRWFLLHCDSAGLDKMMPGFGRFWGGQGRYWEGLHFFEDALALLAQQGGCLEPAAQNRLRYWQAHFLYRHGRYPQARPLLEKMYRAFSSDQDAAYVAAAALDLGSVLMEQGTESAARPLQLYEEALAIFEAQRDDVETAAVLTHLGRYWETAGQYEKAALSHRRSLRLRRKLGAPRQLAYALNQYALLLHRQGENEAANGYLQEAVGLHRQIETQPELAAALANRGLVETALGRYETAVSLLKEARQIQEDQGNRSRLAIIFNNLGDIANLQGQYRQARAYLEESLRIKQALNNERGMTFSLIHLGHALWGMHEFEAAEAAFRQALQLAANLSLAPLKLAALVGMAQLRAATDGAGALALLQLPLSHPAAWQRVQEEAAALAEQIKAALSPEEVKTALARGSGLNLGEVVADMLIVAEDLPGFDEGNPAGHGS